MDELQNLDLEQFLRTRGVSEEIISKFKSENIDIVAVQVMHEDEFKELIPKSGDRAALKEFSRRKLAPRKQSLIEKLKDKIAKANNTNLAQTPTLKHKRKATRVVQVGWMNFNEQNKKFQQVRLNKGGGTRSISVDRDCQVKMILEKAIEIFFPNGISPSGPVNSFEFKLLDFKQHEIDHNMRIQDMFEVTGLSKLRFYLASTSSKIWCSSTNNNIPSSSLPITVESDDDVAVSSPTHASNTEFLAPNAEDEWIMFSDRLSPDLPLENTQSSTVLQSHCSLPDTNELTVLVNSILDSCDKNSTSTADNEVANRNKFMEVDYEDPTDIEELLMKINKLINSSVINKVNVCREQVFQGFVRSVRRPRFSEFNKFSVKFADVEGIAEGAIDEGGPTREMFRIALQEVQNSSMFTGRTQKHLCLSDKHLNKNEYFEVGRLISLSLVHGGPGPRFFCDTLFGLIANIKVQPTLEDVIPEIQVELAQLKDATELSVMQDVVLSSNVFSIAGFKFVKKAEDKLDIINGTLKFYAVNVIHEALGQLLNGLKTCNILEHIRQYPNLFKDIMCSKPSLTAERLENLLLPEWSEAGSNRRHIENRVITYFRDYIIDCEDSELISLNEILAFATGLDSIPPLGFQISPKIIFLHDEPACKFPKANTCSIELKLPVCHNNYDDFKLDMDFGIGNAVGFGFA
ncbi:hypothetical protein PPYR_12030 [Photinus pyralis]|nr:G2/M phase-specific E3 ubiquitin-protein ligase-like isoform X3 [Photinus pyralis]XP_031357865.1 G2/M phase-specific E3 ubiquitin-protein ligase-like isoform X3 [Photinus pyralis]KAB0790677.1 hypothetical protein PPYR_14879 [Photinus pyralis]KAB0795191.1 hypothetical protein PPYR_12030 [Photinus pyralis]